MWLYLENIFLKAIFGMAHVDTHITKEEQFQRDEMQGEEIIVHAFF